MGWIVSNKYRFIFIHIPKTGGTSIAEPDYQGGNGALAAHLGEQDYVQAGHIRAVGLKQRIGSGWDQYFKFAFVRNPWDRAVSLYHYFLQDDEKISSPLGKAIAKCGDFSLFCRDMEQLELDAHFDQQVSYLIDYAGNPLIDYTGRFESINEDFGKICRKVGLPPIELPHYRKSAHRDYRQYYDDRACEIIASRYRDDIRIFNYHFEQE